MTFERGKKTVGFTKVAKSLHAAQNIPYYLSETVW
jgi:hypothetical protein